jgi:hypothetical protein
MVRESRLDGLVESRLIPFSVIPADPGSSPGGIQSFQAFLDPGVRRGDDMKDFLRVHQKCKADFPARIFFLLPLITH